MTPDDIIPGLLPKAALVLLCVPPESGATDLGHHLARRVARIQPAPVLLAAYDRTIPPARDPIPNLTVWRDLRPLDEPPGPVEIAVWCHERRPALVVVDCLYDALARADVHRAEPARRIMRRLAHLTTTGAAVLVVHHTDSSRRRPSGCAALPFLADRTLIVDRLFAPPKILFDRPPGSSVRGETTRNEDHRQKPTPRSREHVVSMVSVVSKVGALGVSPIPEFGLTPKGLTPGPGTPL